jgi:hypothetical protein
MSTLDTQGMVTGYKVNRPLNDHETQHRFNVRQLASNQPHYELSLIRLNSTFVECVDKWYAMRGFVAMGATLLSSLFTAGLMLSISMALKQWHPAAIFVITLGALLLALSLYLLTRDAFTYTHYPIRFNRRNRQVYVFRRDGTVLKAGWEDICWTIYGHLIGSRDLFVVGHVMADDKKTIKETLALSVTTAGRAGEEKLKNHFEFFRRYMEDGPGPVLDAIKPTPLIMLPGIDKEREGWKFGWERLTLHENGSLIRMALYQVFAFPESFVRWIVMRTSKIPQWPQWVEDECAVEPDDPWVRDGRHRA